VLSILLIQLEQHSTDPSPHMASSLEPIHLIMIIATLACLAALINAVPTSVTPHKFARQSDGVTPTPLQQLASDARTANQYFENLHSNTDCRKRPLNETVVEGVFCVEGWRRECDLTTGQWVPEAGVLDICNGTLDSYCYATVVVAQMPLLYLNCTSEAIVDATLTQYLEG